MSDLDRYQVERYSLAAVPTGHWLNFFTDIGMYGVTLVWRNEGQWAITRGRFMEGGMVWHDTEGWTYEPLASERSRAFKKHTRFTLDQAAAIGAEIAAAQLTELERRHRNDPRLPSVTAGENLPIS